MSKNNPRFIAATLAGSLAVSVPVCGTDVPVPAPTCQVNDLHSSQNLDWASRKGKVLYVDFWASWCVPCAHSLPFMDQLQADLGAKGLEVIAISLDENRDDAVAFIKNHPVKITLAYDPAAKCPEQFAVQGMPQSFVIDRKGNIRSAHLGFKKSDQAELRQLVENLLSER